METWEVPNNNNEEVWEKPSKPLSELEIKQTNDLFREATGDFVGYEETEEGKEKVVKDFEEQEELRRKEDVYNYLSESVANGSLTAKDFDTVKKAAMLSYAYKPTLEDAAATNAKYNPANESFDIVLKEHYSKNATLNEFYAKAKKDYDEQNIVYSAALGFAKNVWSPVASYIKNWIAPKGQEVEYLSKDIITASRKYWGKRAAELSSAEFREEFSKFYQGLVERADAGTVLTYMEGLTQARNRDFEGIEEGIEYFDIGMPVLSWLGAVAKGAKISAATAKALTWTFPLTSTTFKIGTLGAKAIAKQPMKFTNVLKDNRVIGISDAEKLKQAGKYDEACKSLLESSPSEEVLKEVAPPTRTYTNINMGTDLSSNPHIKDFVKVQELIRAAKTSNSYSVQFEKNMGEFLEQRYIPNFVKNTTWKRNSVSLVEAFADGSGGIVRLTNNGKYWKTEEDASNALIDIMKGEGFLKEDVDKSVLRELGFYEKGVRPIRVLEGRGVKFAIHIPVKTEGNLLDWTPTTLKSFKTAEAAEAAIKKAKAEGIAKVQKAGEHDYRVAPTTNEPLPTALQGAPTKFTKGFLTNIFSSLGTKASWRGLALTTLRDAGKMDKVLLDYINPFYKALSKNELEELDKFVKTSSKNRMYFSETSLQQQGASQKIIEAYNALRVVNDVMYVLDASFLRGQQVIRGFSTIAYFGKPIAVGKRLDPDKIKNISNYDWAVLSGDDVKIAKGPNILKDFPADEYEFIRLDILKSNLKSKNLIIPKNAVEFRELPTYPETYVAGYRHLYGEDTSFVKMVVPVRNDAGQIIDLDRVVTIGGSKSFQSASKYTEELNAALEVVRGGDPAAVSTLEGRFKNFSFEELKQFFDDMGIDATAPNAFEVLKDGELPKALAAAKVSRAETLENLDDMFQHSVRGMEETEANIINRKRNLGLLDIDGGDLDTVNVKTLLTDMIDNIVNTVGIKEYRRIAGDDFYKTFKHLLDPNEVSSMTPYQLLLYGKLNNGPDIRAAEAAQAQARVICGVPSKLDIFLNNLWNHFKEDFLVKYFPELRGTDFDRNVLEDFPVKSVRAARLVTFQALLGCLNPGPFFQNVLSASIAISINPAAGTEALRYTPKIMGLLGKPYNSEALKMLDPKEKKIFEFANELAVHGQALDYSGYAEGIAKVGKRISNILAAPFAVGERFVRTHAAVTTVIEALAKNPDINPKSLSATEMAFYLDRMDTFYNRMSRASVAPIQRGIIGSVTLQMLGYQMRVVESLFSKKLTAAEKGRLLAFATVLTGAEGVIGKEVWANIYSAMYSDTDQDPGEMYEALSKGIPDYFLQNILGSNLSVSSPIDLQISQIVPNFLHLVNPAASPIGTKLKGLGGLIVTAVNMTNDALFGEQSFADTAVVIPEVLFEVAKQNQLFPTSMTKAMRAYTMIKLGEFQALSGATLADNVKPSEAFGYFLGGSIEPASVASMYRKIVADKDEETEVAAAIIKPFFEKFNAEPTVETYNKWSSVYRFVTTNMTEREKEKVLQACSKAAKVSYEDMRIKMITYNVGVVKNKENR